LKLRTPRLGLRTLFLLAFLGVFLAWVFSALVLVDRMRQVDDRGAGIREELLSNEHVLSTVSTQVLLGAVYLRDAIQDPRPDRGASFEKQIAEIRGRVDRAVGDYVAGVTSPEERRRWRQLQTEIDNYWASMPSVLTISAVRSPADASDVLRDDVIPRREAIIRLADDIHELGRRGLEQDQLDLRAERQVLRRRVWQISGVGFLVGMGIAFFAARHAGRLEHMIRTQLEMDRRQKFELERLSARLMEVQEQERRRLSRELHDDVGQALSAIKLELAAVEQKAGDSSLTGRLSEARAMTDQALQAVRDVSRLLHPSMLDDLGLTDTVEWYLKAFSKRSQVRSDLAVEGTIGRLPPDVALCAYRVIQEATTNIARHADAASCRVAIASRPDSLEVVVEDDGLGFDPDQVGHRGLGLVSIRERVAGLGGHMALDSRPGRGTRLLIELPLAGGDDHDDGADSDR
jgi:signal transduction histidine kinase